MKYIILSLMALAIISPAFGQTIVTQKSLPVEEVVGGSLKIPKEQREKMREERKLQKKEEKELRQKLAEAGVDDRFLLNGKKQKAKRVKHIPANSTSY